MHRALVIVLFLLSALAVLGTGCSGDSPPATTATDPGPPPVTLPPTTLSPTITAAPTTSTTAPPATTTQTTEPSPVTTDNGTGGGGSGLDRQEYTRLPVEEQVVALTFDAAYDPAPLDDILAALDEAAIPGTFFLTGEFVEDFPDSVRAIVSRGHPVGNHSYSHPDFTKIGPDETRNQLRRTADLLRDVGADDPRPLFRPPFGARDATVLGRLESEGYVSIYWTIDTLDWKPERTPVQVKESVLQGLRPGAIVLMHVGSRQTAQVLPELIGEIRARGYRFVTVSDGLGL
jgi:peptidoglycan/xylan/chitin deacetylase (PgdA/CDA1 family)